MKTRFSKLIKNPAAKPEESKILKASWIPTPLGTMIAIGDEKTLYLLEFMNRHQLDREIKKIQKATRSIIEPGKTTVIDSIEHELSKYFKRSIDHFLTPIKMIGSPFQISVWLELKKIPISETRSYSDIAKQLGNERAVRAVGQANGSNRLAIIIPCHRVIKTGGQLGGYANGLTRKKWLLQHESIPDKMPQVNTGFSPKRTHPREGCVSRQ